MRTRRRALVVLLAILPAMACVSLKRTPEARFFYLRALAEPAAAPADGTGELVGVLPVRLAGHLERPQLVTRVAPGELRIDEFLRWAEPLGAGVTRTLTENLGRLLPEQRVVRLPAVPGTTRCRVALELAELGPGEDRTVRLEGRFTLLAPEQERALVVRGVRLARGPLPATAAGIAPQDAVNAMSVLIEELSREIAAAVRALPAAQR